LTKNIIGYPLASLLVGLRRRTRNKQLNKEEEEEVDMDSDFDIMDDDANEHLVGYSFSPILVT
jgi:hypothetical protein